MKISKYLKAAVLTFLFAALFFGASFGTLAHAEVSLIGTRIGAPDTPALAEFYKKVFGLKEINRLLLDSGQLEIMLNFGDTVAAAQANPSPQIILIQEASKSINGAVPHLIFRVPDVDSYMTEITSMGGTIITEPFTFGDAGIRLGFATDPQGNQIELIQIPE